MGKLESALEDCLARLVEDPHQGTSGEVRLEECLALYPEHARELRQLLGAAAQLEQGRTVRAPSQFKTRTRAQLATHMAAHPRGPTIMVGHTRAGVQWRPRPRGPTFGFASFPPVTLRLAFGLAALVALFLVTGTALAQGALPGSVGYGWKITSERAWRVFQPDPLVADLVLATRRADELALVADDPGAQPIALQGYRQALETVGRYTLPVAQPLIREALVEQQQSLNQAGLDVPELNALLTTVTSEPAPPTSTLSPPTSTLTPPTSTLALPASTLAPLTPTLALPPETTLIPAPESPPVLPRPTLPLVLLTPGVVSSTVPGLPLPTLVLTLPLPTLKSLLP